MVWAGKGRGGGVKPKRPPEFNTRRSLFFLFNQTLVALLEGVPAGIAGGVAQFGFDAE